MKYLISKIRIPTESIPDLLEGFKFKTDYKQEYSSRLFINDMVFDFSISLYVKDDIIDVYYIDCNANRTSKEHISVELPDNIEFERYIQIMYKKKHIIINVLFVAFTNSHFDLHEGERSFILRMS